MMACPAGRDPDQIPASPPSRAQKKPPRAGLGNLTSSQGSPLQRLVPRASHLVVPNRALRMAPGKAGRPQMGVPGRPSQRKNPGNQSESRLVKVENRRAGGSGTGFWTWVTGIALPTRECTNRLPRKTPVASSRVQRRQPRHKPYQTIDHQSVATVNNKIPSRPLNPWALPRILEFGAHSSRPTSFMAAAVRD